MLYTLIGIVRSNLSAWLESLISNGFILYTLHSIPGGSPMKLPVCLSVLKEMCKVKTRKFMQKVWINVFTLSSEWKYLN